MSSSNARNSTIFEKEALLFFAITIEVENVPHIESCPRVTLEDSSYLRPEFQDFFDQESHRPISPLHPKTPEHTFGTPTQIATL